MRKFFKLICLGLVFVSTCLCFAACENGGAKGNDGGEFPEKVQLAQAMLKEVEFENSDMVKLKQKDGEVTVTGNIDEMSKSQKNVYGDDGVSHVVVVKFTFDKERTLSYFKIFGDDVRVYSDEKNVENYTGSISELLDNESGEDSYCNLILSAKTKEYKFLCKYSDGKESVVTLKIDATLASSKSE